jgi:hypothetical protein
LVRKRCQACFDDGHWLVFLLVGSPGTPVQSVPLSFGVPVTAKADEFALRPSRATSSDDD